MTSHTYFDIYLVYDTPRNMSGICLVYVWYMFSESFGHMSGICLVYVWYMFSESFGHMPGIYLTYDFVCEMPRASGWALLHLQCDWTGLHTVFGCHEDLMSLSLFSVLHHGPSWRAGS